METEKIKKHVLERYIQRTKKSKAHNEKAKIRQFWIYYLFAVIFGIAGMLWIAFGNGWIFEAMGQPLLPDPFSGLMELIKERRVKYGLPPDSILATFSLLSDHWFAFPSYIFPASPSIAAILIVWYSSRGRGVKALFSRFSFAQPGITAGQGIKFNGLIFLALIIYTFTLAFLSGLNADAGFAGNLANLRFDAPLHALLLLFAGGITSRGAILEELGWRGFAWPSLQKIMKTPLHAALLLGVLWPAWHLPREVVMLTGGAPFDQFLLGQIEFFIAAMSLTIIIGYAVNKARGSIIPAIMIHGVSNYLGQTVDSTTVFFVFDTHSLLKVALAIAIIYFVGSQLGYKKPEDDKGAG